MTNLQVNEIRKDFPIFAQNENQNLIYFDNAATSQRPLQVINAINDFSEVANANPLRGLYSLSTKATQYYEDSRVTVQNFINAKKYEEIIFTRNATESLNLIAYSYAMQNVNEGDEIVVSIMEHHSNILPWQMVAKAKKAKLIYLEIDKNTFEIPESEFNKITEKTKIVAITYTSNVLGITNPVKKIAQIAHSKNAVVVVDAAQAIAHTKIDVQEIDADFFVFSGHKVLGPFGIGVLYAKYSLLSNMQPFLRGGEMIEYVTREDATYAELPHKFEAGTVNASGAYGLKAALEYINLLGYEKITEHDLFLSKLLLEGLSKIPYVKIIGSEDATKHSGIVTFTIDGVHPHDIASVLDTENIAIRAGHHCAQPLGAYLDVQSTARASVYFYNTEDEIAAFIDKVSKIRSWMGYKD